MTTERFRLGTGAFFTRLVYLHGTLPISVVIVLFSVAVILAFALDSRFAIVAVMVALLIVPLAMSSLYFSHGLLPDYSFNVSWHKLKVTNEGIEIILFKPIYEIVRDEDSDEEKEKLVKWEEAKRMKYDRTTFGGILTGGDGITIPVKGKKGMIAVPRNAFATLQDYENFVVKIVSGK